jgi:hypothetical protein
VVTLRDATGARPASIFAYAIAVTLTIYATACFLAHSLWPYGHAIPAPSNAEAVVAVLLLVPGFLYTRLDLPARHTILGHLRLMSRQLAHVCIGAAILLAAAVAAGLGGWWLWLLFVFATVVPAAATVPLILPPFRRGEPVPGLADAPRWLWPARRRSGAPPVDAVFRSSGSDVD